MNVRWFDKLRDYETLQGWMLSRRMKMPPITQLPKRGWIVDGVGCCFLIKTDASIGMIEYFITNPHASKEDREEASVRFFEELQKEGRRLKMEVLIGYTSLHKVIGIGLGLEFKSDGKPYYYFRKTLEEE